MRRDTGRTREIPKLRKYGFIESSTSTPLCFVPTCIKQGFDRWTV